MKTPDELIERIERGFTVGLSTTTWRSVTGKRYIVIGSQYPGLAAIPGTVDEGASRELALDEETACMQALACFETYADGRGRYLYWRVKPCLEWNNDHTRCMVYMRCVVSEIAPKGNP